MCDGRQGGEVEGESVLLRVAAHALERQAVHERAIGRRQARGHVAPAMVGRPRRARVAHREEAEGLRRRRHALVGVHEHVGRVVEGEEPQAIQVQHLLELVRHAQLVAPVPGREPPGGDAHGLDGVGLVSHARGLVVAHLPRAEEVGQELEPLAVPRVEVRAGGGLAVELVDGKRGAATRLGRRAHLGLGLHDAGHPDDPHRVGRRPRAEAEHHVGRGGHRHRRRGLDLLAEAAGADLDLRPHAAPARHATGELHRERVVAVAALVHQAAEGGGSRQERVLVAVGVEIGHGQGGRLDRPFPGRRP